MSERMISAKLFGPLPTWKKVWREGLAPKLSTAQLQALQRGLIKDDPRLVQGATTSPPPMQSVLDWPCEAGCLISYPFAFEEYGNGNESDRTVGETEEFFAKVCFEIDQVLG